MYNRLYNYSIQTFSIKKQFGFQEGYSADHAILRLVDQIYNNFERNNFTLGVIIELSKTLDPIDQNILL